MWFHPRSAVISERSVALPANLQLLALLLALNVADVVLTHVNLTLGIAVEANPILRLMLEHSGWTGLYLFKVAGPVLLSLLILRLPVLTGARWFGCFLSLLCLISLSGVCSGVFVIATVLF